MEKGFNQAAREALSKCFNVETPEGMADIGEHVQDFISKGISKAIRHRLNPLIGQPDYHTLVIGPFAYSHTKFNLADDVEFFDNLAEYEKEPKDNLALIFDISNEINDPAFVQTAINYTQGWTFDIDSLEWTEPVCLEDKGVAMDEGSMKTAIAIHVLTTVYILLRSRDKEESVVVEVPNEGIYTIEWKDCQWAIGFTLSE